MIEGRPRKPQEIRTSNKRFGKIIHFGFTKVEARNKKNIPTIIFFF